MGDLRDAIASLAAQGLSARAIARDLGLASPTVDYHLGRLRSPAPEHEEWLDSPASAAVTHVTTRAEVRRLLALGWSRSAIARRLDLSKSTVSYHARRLGHPVDRRGARRYDWAAVQAYYDQGHSVRECRARFGFSSQSWHAAVKRGAVVARPHALPIADLCTSAPRGRWNLKRRLIAAGLKEERCEECGITEWRGARLVMALHHRNGDRHDNRLDNLQLLCPNCHSQTASWGGRNRARVEPPPGGATLAGGAC